MAATEPDQKGDITEICALLKNIAESVCTIQQKIEKMANNIDPNKEQHNLLIMQCNRNLRDMEDRLYYVKSLQSGQGSHPSYTTHMPYSTANEGLLDDQTVNTPPYR